MAFTLEIPSVSKLLLSCTSQSMQACCQKLNFIMRGPALPRERKNNRMQIKWLKTSARGTFLLFHISIPHGPLRRQAKVVSLGQGIAAVEGDEVHDHPSPGTGQKVSPGKDLGSSRGQIKAKQKMKRVSGSTQSFSCCSLVITIIILLVLLNNCSNYEIMPGNQCHGT